MKLIDHDRHACVSGGAAKPIDPTAIDPASFLPTIVPPFRPMPGITDVAT